MSLNWVTIAGKKYLLSTCENITERWQVKQKLADNQQRLADILSSIQEGMYELDFNWRFTFLNESAARSMQSGLEELVGKDIREKFPWIVGSEYEQIFQQVMETRQPNQRELKSLLEEGIWYNLIVNPSAGGITVYWQDITARKQAETLLRFNQDKFSIIFDQSPTPTFLISIPTGRFLDVNRAYLDLVGFERDEVLGKTPAELGIIRDQISREIDLRSIPAQITIQEAEVVHYTKAGEMRIASAQYGAVEIGDEKMMLGTVTDITKIRQAEKTLQDQNARLRLLTDAASQLLRGDDPQALLDGIYQHLSDLLGLEVYVHYRIEDEQKMILAALSGFTEKEQKRLKAVKMGETISGEVALTRKPVVLEDAQQSLDPHTTLVRSLGIRAYCCHPLIVKDRLIGTLSFGSRRHTAFDAASIDLIRAVCDLVANAIDRSQQALALHESSYRFDLVLRNSPVIMYTIDQDRRYIWVSNPMRGSSGIQVEQMQGKRDEDLLPLEDVAEVVEFKQHVLQTGITERREVKFRTGGRTYIYDTFLEPVKTEAGKVVGLIGVTVDMTERRHWEEQLHADMDRMEVQQRLLEQREQERLMIARDLHDGPVQDLLGIIYTLQDIRDGLAGAPPRLIDDLIQIQQALSDQVVELRAFAGELRPSTLIKFGLDRAIRSHLESWQEKYPGMQVKFVCDQREQMLPEHLCLPLYRIYQETLANIVKHARASQIDIHLEKNVDGMVRLTIQDNGVGFEPPQDCLKLVREGHLGLAGIRERAEAIGGRAEIDSAPGQGTRVRISVPLAKQR